MAATTKLEIEPDADISVFRLWRVDRLKSFCKTKGLPTSNKCKDELVALAYAAHVQKLPAVPTKEEDTLTRKNEYRQLLRVDHDDLPDPFSDLQEGWLNERDGLKLWPPTMYMNIAVYLVEKDERELLTRLKNDYKEGKAFSYFASQNSWIKDVFFHEISTSSTLCFLKSECTPSQSVKKLPHKLWVCLEKETGDIKSAYCTCFAGLGSTCNHVAALLFKVDYAWQNGMTSGCKKACTSLENKWIAPSLKVVEPVKAEHMVFSKPQYAPKKRPVQKNCVARKLYSAQVRQDIASPSLDSLTASLYPACPMAVAFHYALPSAKPQYSPCDNINVGLEMECTTFVSVPPPLPIVASEFSDCSDMLENLPTYSPAEVKALEEETREQCSCEAWKSQRKGRITASLVRQVFTKYKHAEPQFENVKLLLNTIMGRSINLNLPAFKYGHQNEPFAVDLYKSVQCKHHTGLKVTKCGLFVVPTAVYVAASPDRKVFCECCGDGLLEVKCPISLQGMDPKECHVPYLKNVDGKVSLNRNHDYYSQIQQQMGVTGCKWCDLFVYTKTHHFLERVFFEENHWNALLTASKHFFAKFICPELFKSRKNEL